MLYTHHTILLPIYNRQIFGSLGTARYRQYKWHGIGYAHPHNEVTAHQAIHWARLAAKKWLKYHHITSHTRHKLVPKSHTTYMVIPWHPCCSSLCRRHHQTWRTNNPSNHQQTTDKNTSNAHILHPPPKPQYWLTQPNSHNQNNNRQPTNNAIQHTKNSTHTITHP